MLSEPLAPLPRLIVVGPLPPPFHGVSVSTTLVLANPRLGDHFAPVEHVDTSDHRSRGNIGTWDVTNVRLAFVHLARLWRALRGRRGVVYVSLAQGLPGFLRDSLLIHAAAARGWRVAGHLRGSELRSHLYERRGPLARAWIRFTLRRLTGVAVLGDAIRPVFDGLVAPERLAVVPNGTTEPALTGIAPVADRVVFLSNLRERKGLFVALESAIEVLDRRPTARFVFAGAWESDEVERRARALAAPHGAAIVFRDVVTGEEKDRLLGSASVFLFSPTEPEGHPRVVLEALAAGVPTVTVARGAIPDTVLDGVTGFVLPDPDAVTLAERTLRLLEDPELRQRMSRAGRERYEQRFTQELADRWLAEWLAGVASTPVPRRRAR